jgi:hypothetical protein
MAILLRGTGRGLMTGQYKSRDDFEDGDFRKWAPRFNEEVSPGAFCSFALDFLPSLTASTVFVLRTLQRTSILSINSKRWLNEKDVLRVN